ncbi:MAG: hypothetical protein J6U20_08230 [Fibrobacter sp.]|nr:hypothetical protein [Fibrobacter sp.]
MDHEYSIYGNILCEVEGEFTLNGVPLIVKGGQCRLKEAAMAKDIDESTLKNLCKALSEKLHCKAQMRRVHEVYGNSNVFNGGSDYDVVEEYRFECAFDDGQEV